MSKRTFLVCSGLVTASALGAAADAPPGRYTYAVGGLTVRDNRTGLTWQRKAYADASACADDAACVALAMACGSDANCTAAEALAFCDALVLEGTLSFRLPTKPELESLVDDTRKSPALDVAAFPATPNGPNDPFWSASLHHFRSPDQWVVNFDFGTAYNDTPSVAHRVRCVSN